MEQHPFTKHRLFFLVVFIILLLSYFAYGMHVPQQERRVPFPGHRLPYRFTQPEPPQDPVGDLTWGRVCGKYGETKDLLDCTAKEGYGYCAKGLRCRQTGSRLGNKCLCL